MKIFVSNASSTVKFMNFSIDEIMASISWAAYDVTLAILSNPFEIQFFTSLTD